MASFGARAFLKLGRDDDAYELARLAVSPEQNTVKKTTLVSCHSILGQVAAKRGELEAADGHFADALAEAKLSLDEGRRSKYEVFWKCVSNNSFGERPETQYLDD